MSDATRPQRPLPTLVSRDEVVNRLIRADDQDFATTVRFINDKLVGATILPVCFTEAQFGKTSAVRTKVIALLKGQGWTVLTVRQGKDEAEVTYSVE